MAPKSGPLTKFFGESKQIDGTSHCVEQLIIKAERVQSEDFNKQKQKCIKNLV